MKPGSKIEIASSLVSLDRGKFAAVLQLISDEDVDDCIVALASSSLRVGERDRRVRLVVKRGSFTEERTRALCSRLAETGPGVLNAVRASIPENLRPYATIETSKAVRLPPPYEPDIDLSIFELEGDEQDPPTYCHVILVGNDHEQERNEEFLADYPDLIVIRADELNQFDSLATHGFCGVVVGSSVWEGIDSDTQCDHLEKICRTSSFTFIRLSTKGLKADIDSVAEKVRCGNLDSKRFRHGATALLDNSDVRSLRSSAVHLRHAESSFVRALGLTDEEAFLLRLIGSDGEAEPASEHSVSPLAGGRSQAKTFLLETARRDRMPIRRVVRITNDSLLLEREIQQFNEWIKDWEDGTDPVFYQHLGCCAIAYRLHKKEGSSLPAPTLQERIDNLVTAEWRTNENYQELGADLRTAVGRAVARLESLNSKTASGSGEGVWFHCACSGLLERKISLLRRQEAMGLACVWAKVGRIGERLQGLPHTAVVHGDINSGNILFQDRTPVFIDFEKSGPGNPFIDMVRLDAVVRALAMRAILPEQDLVGLYRELYIEGKTVQELGSLFPSVLTSPACLLALETATGTRASAANLARIHKADWADYLGLVAVIAAYALAARSPGSATDRACLLAVIEEASSVSELTATGEESEPGRKSYHAPAPSAVVSRQPVSNEGP